MALTAYRLRHRVDIVHANWMLAGLSASILKTFTGLPFILTLRGSDMMIAKNRILRFLYRPIIRSASAITVVSEDFGRELESAFGVPRNKIHWIPNGITLADSTPEREAALRERMKIHEAGKILVCLGSVIPRKSVITLVELLALPGMSEYRLLVCGRTDHSEYLEELRATAERLGCAGRIHISGGVAPDEVHALLKLSDYFLTASTYEGRPNAVLEALAAGKIVFASDIPAHREIIRHGVNGFLFDPRALEEVALQLERLNADPGESARIADAARASVGPYDWNTCAGSYLAIYRTFAKRQ
jgi:glycosyltransferase involved in cell wall biosynthesis